MTAIISSCGLYRYRLERTFIQAGPRVAVVMVNPSTADGEFNDATIRKLLAFGRHLGWGALIVGNLFAYRATDVRELGACADPVGPENDNHLWRIARECDEVIFAWGPLAKQPKALRDRWRRADFLFRAAGKFPLSIGPTTKDGQPGHPLFLRVQTPLMLWSPPRV